MRNDPERKLPQTLMLVEQLIERGVDVDQDHAVEHFFVGTVEHATLVGELFDESGYTVSSAPNAKSEEDFSVLLSHPIDADTMTKAIVKACEIAERHELGYDGWDADVSRWKLKGAG